VTVEGSTVSVSGPRIGRAIYRLWIAAQLLLLVLVPGTLVAGLVFRDWRYLTLALAILVAHFLVGSIGAASFWEIANMAAIGSGHPTVSFPVTAVKEVKIGPGWARKGLWLVILPYVAQINKMSEGHTVSFEASDSETGEAVVCAFHMHTEEDARALAGLLEGQ
jgi:hypothetical protein